MQKCVLNSIEIFICFVKQWYLNEIHHEQFHLIWVPYDLVKPEFSGHMFWDLPMSNNFSASSIWILFHHKQMHCILLSFDIVLGNLSSNKYFWNILGRQLCTRGCTMCNAYQTVTFSKTEYHNLVTVFLHVTPL